jgi:twinkle protein
MIGIEGNKDPDLPEEERNLRSLIILEDREFGCSDRIHLYWNNKTGLFTEV